MPTKESFTREVDQRPWGRYLVLDEAPDFKVKRIEVLPGKRLSFQRHNHRAEHWYIVSGKAKVTLNEKEILVSAPAAIDIAKKTAHRVENPDASELLIFIEVQTGEYFGEDDIERLDDDYGRIEK